MKKYILVASLMFLFFYLVPGYIYAEDDGWLELPIIEDAYAKEYWPSTRTFNYSHLSLGYSTLYPEKRTELYISADLGDLNDMGITPTDIIDAELVLTLFRKMGEHDLDVMIYDVPVPIDLKTLTWATRPILSGPYTEFLLPMYVKERSVPIIDQLLNALERGSNELQIAIKMKVDIEPGIMFYSTECTNGSYYLPACEAGMEPKIRVKIQDLPPKPSNIEFDPIVISKLATTVTWDNTNQLYCRVAITDSDLLQDQEWSNEYATIDVNSAGIYEFMLDCKNDPGSGLSSFSDIYSIEFQLLSTVTPTTLEISDQFMITEDLGFEPLWTAEYTLGVQRFFIQNHITKQELCDTNISGEKIILTAFLHDGSLYSAPSIQYEVICSINENENPEQTFDLPEPDKKEEKISSPFPKDPKDGNDITPRDPKKDELDRDEQPRNDTRDEGSLPYLVDKPTCFLDKQNNTLECPGSMKKVISSSCTQYPNSLLCKLEIALPYQIDIKERNRYCEKDWYQKLFSHSCSYSENSYTPKYQLIASYNNTQKPSDQQISIHGTHIFTTSLVGTDETELFLEIYIPEISTKYLWIEEIKYSKEKFLDRKLYEPPFKQVIGVTQWHGYTAYDSPHTGIDFGATRQKIYAIDDGYVYASGYDTYLGECNSGGYFLNIEHLDKRHSIYLHLEKESFEELGLKKGQYLHKGQYIGITGNSGSYNCQPLGYHLHLEIRSSKAQKTHIDPVPLIDYEWDKVMTLGSDKYPGRLTGDNPHPNY